MVAEPVRRRPDPDQKALVLLFVPLLLAARRGLSPFFFLFFKPDPVSFLAHAKVGTLPVATVGVPVRSAGLGHHIFLGSVGLLLPGNRVVDPPYPLSSPPRHLIRTEVLHFPRRDGGSPRSRNGTNMRSFVFTFGIGSCRSRPSRVQVFSESNPDFFLPPPPQIARRCRLLIAGSARRFPSKDQSTMSGSDSILRFPPSLSPPFT